MPIKQSLCIPLYQPDGLDLAAFCQKVAGMGYQGVEIWFRDETFGELMEAVKSAGLTLASMAGHTSLTDGLNKRENHDRIETEIIESIDFSRFSVKVFTVENNYYGKKLRKLMSAKNYSLINTVGDDEVYEWRV